MARFANFQPQKASRQGETWLFTNRLCRSYVLVETSFSQPVRPDAMAARGSKSVKDPLCCRFEPLFGRRTSALSEAEAPNTVPSMARAYRSDLKGFAWRPRRGSLPRCWRPWWWFLRGLLGFGRPRELKELHTWLEHRREKQALQAVLLREDLCRCHVAATVQLRQLAAFARWREALGCQDRRLLRARSAWATVAARQRRARRHAAHAVGLRRSGCCGGPWRPRLPLLAEGGLEGWEPKKRTAAQRWVLRLSDSVAGHLSVRSNPVPGSCVQVTSQI